MWTSVASDADKALRDWGRAERSGTITLIFLILTGVASAAGFAMALGDLLTGRGGVVAATALAAALAARSISGWAQTNLARRRARRICGSVRARAVSRVLERRRGSQTTIGEDIAACVDDVEALDGYYARFALAALEARIAPIAVACVVAVRSPVSAAILVGTMIPLIAVLALAGGAAGQAASRQLESLARLSGLFVDRIRALPLILAYRAEARTEAEVARAAEGLAARTLRVLRIALISSAALEFFAAVAVALTAVYCGFSLLGLMPFKPPEQLDLASAVYALALAPEFYAPLRRLAAAYHEKQLGEAAAERLVRTDLGDEPMTAPAVSAAAPLAPPRIALRQASRVFGPERIGPVDAEIPPCTLAVLLGASGSGKTSLLSALTGEEPLSSGEITLDGRPVSTDLGGQIAWAGQSPAFAPGTIFDNLRAADPSLSEAAAEAMLRRLGFGEALDRRADGLATQLDERGSGLSGGERRRLALARALLKPSGLLVLDEPTSELDAASQAAIIQIICEAAKTRTVVAATHSPELAAVAATVVRL